MVRSRDASFLSDFACASFADAPDPPADTIAAVSDKPDLVERRQRFIQRQIATDRSAVNVRFANRRPEGSGASNRHGMPKLPLGQHEVKNWPVLDLGEQPHV